MAENNALKGELAETYSVITTAGENIAIIRSTGGKLRGFMFLNTGSAIDYVKLYDKAAAPASTDTPKLRIPVPHNTAAGAGIVAMDFPAGLQFKNGIGIRVTGGLADADTANATALTVINVIFE